MCVCDNFDAGQSVCWVFTQYVMCGVVPTNDLIIVGIPWQEKFEEKKTNSENHNVEMCYVLLANHLCRYVCLNAVVTATLS